ncbi:MAG: anti-sigma factor [Pseudomonadota bacterium]
MTVSEEKLSAFLDGELSEADARAVEAALAEDPSLQAALEALMTADTAAQDAFDMMLNEPVPAALAATVRDAPEAGVANIAAPPEGSKWWAAAAVVLALGLGGAGGYMTGLTQTPTIAAAPGWLVDIADYHAVYAGQTRHLVEVGADEAEHIRTWLTRTVGADVPTPDLTSHGLTFRGARLLVAAGKPVAQLMYTDAEDRVVALCLIATDTPRDGTATQTIGSFDMVSWGGDGANLVIVGDQGRSDLEAIAATAASEA